MDDRLTAQQRAAVEDRGRTLLVSAAAGSGKTMVLVERLFSYVEQEGADLDDFLIITYTRAAAAELRSKIAKRLAEKLRETPGDAHLQRQMLHLYRADIKTVDAFCTALLRENCHLIREDENRRTLRPDFRVLDENEAKSMKKRVLSRALEHFYQNLDDGGRQLANTLGAGRDDRRLEELVLEIHAKLQAQPYVGTWIAEQRERWANMPERIEETPYGALLLERGSRTAAHWAKVLSDAAAEMAESEALSQKYAPAFLDVAAQLTALAEAARDSWDTVVTTQIEFPRLTAVRGSDDAEMKTRMQSLWNTCKKRVEALRAAFSVRAEDAMADMHAVAPAMLALLALTEDFLRAYQTEKRRCNAADFSDQEHEAIKLLLREDGSPSELAELVAQRYREIMVDEYQDTNEVQNRIFSAISREGRNLFTVGDVKQSIYRFRLADPRIFLEHYTTYPPAAEAAEGESAKLLLTKNFRSRREVLEATNFVFSNILSRDMGELDYGEDEALRLGASYPPAERAAEFHLIDAAVQNDEETRKATELEAAFAADYIRKLLSSEFPVQDDKTGEPRPVTEDDIVILMRAPNDRIPIFRRALEEKGLRCQTESDEQFYETMEISVIYSLLRLIDNPRQDIPLISVLRSPLFGFSPDRLAQLRALMRSGDFYDALLADEAEDTQRFLTQLNELRLLSQTVSAYELIGAIYERFHVPAVFGAMPDGARRKENLQAFFRLAVEQDAAGFRGLFPFVRHLQDLLEAGEPLVPRLSHGAQGIRIMSIHKSKGLEFPVVLLADLARGFSRMDFNASVLVHSELGLGPTYVDEERRIQYPSLARQALEETLRREAKAEEMRVLYVAMTRAKEKLVMLYTRKNLPKYLAGLISQASCPVPSETAAEQSCMGDWILLPLLCRQEAAPLWETAGSTPTTIVQGEDQPWLAACHLGLEGGEDVAAHGEEQAEEVPTGAPLDLSVFSWRYPYEAESALPAKMTATQLKGRVLDEAVAEGTKIAPRLRQLQRPRFLLGERELDPAQRGTAVHAALQYLDFSLPAKPEAVEAALAAMRDKRLLTSEQTAAVDRKMLLRFLESPLCTRIAGAEQVEREYRFSILHPASAFAPSLTSDDRVLLQGVIDCFFEEDGGLVVVDFKTDRVFGDDVAVRAESYRPQLTAYADALERIMEKPVREKLLYFLAPGREVAL